MRPRLLDLFCCAGGCSMGYYDAGFDIVGVDITPRRDYPFEFIEADALDILADSTFLDTFDVVHASPPCQRYSVAAHAHGNAETHPDFLPPTRELLRAWGGPYVIENVEGAPLRNPVMLCGSMFPELRVYRHRLFESNVALTAPAHPRHLELTFTHDKRKAHYGTPLDLETMRVQVTGGGNAPVWAKRQAMGGLDWMTGHEVNEAIPPIYTQYLGEQLLDHLARTRETA